LNGTVANTVVCTPTDNTLHLHGLANSEGFSLAPLFPGGTGNFNLNTLRNKFVGNQMLRSGYPNDDILLKH
jgi:hypothetical protein